MRARLLLSMVLATFASAEATGQNGVSIGYTTGESYRSLNRDAQARWFVGVLDGVMADAFYLPGELEREGVLKIVRPYPGYLAWLSTCVQSHTVVQLEAIFRKQLEATPESWHAPAALVARKAIVDFCKPAPKTPQRKE